MEKENKYKAKKIDGKRIDEHRYIMELHLGRKLESNEVVHHIDGNKSNNDISNLVIMSLSEHSRLHQTGRKMTEEAKRKISIAGKGKLCYSLRSLSPEEVNKILLLKSENLSNRKIAKIIGTSRSTIDRVINGTEYNDITGF